MSQLSGLEIVAENNVFSALGLTDGLSDDELMTVNGGWCIFSNSCTCDGTNVTVCSCNTQCTCNTNSNCATNNFNPGTPCATNVVYCPSKK